MTLRLPEHVVDVWLGIEVHRAIPQALIWAPTPRAQPAWDVGMAQPGRKTALFECKGTIVREASGEHRIPIDIDQLVNYAIGRHGGAELMRRLYYLLPCPPWDGRMAGPDGVSVPAVAEHRTHPARFDDWSWVVPSDGVLAYLTGMRLITQHSHDLHPNIAQRLSGALPLREFLEKFAKCEVGVVETDSIPVRQAEPYVRQLDEEILDLGNREFQESRHLVGVSIDVDRGA